jgi:hypothetical protein
MWPPSETRGQQRQGCRRTIHMCKYEYLNESIRYRGPATNALPGRKPTRVQTWFMVNTPSYLLPLRIRLLHVAFSILNSFVKRPSKPYRIGCRCLSIYISIKACRHCSVYIGYDKQIQINNLISEVVVRYPFSCCIGNENIWPRCNVGKKSFQTKILCWSLQTWNELQWFLKLRWWGPPPLYKAISLWHNFYFRYLNEKGNVPTIATDAQSKWFSVAEHLLLQVAQACATHKKNLL